METDREFTDESSRAINQFELKLSSISFVYPTLLEEVADLILGSWMQSANHFDFKFFFNHSNICLRNISAMAPCGFKIPQI